MLVHFLLIQYDVMAVAGGLHCYSKQPVKTRARHEASLKLIEALKKLPVCVYYCYLIIQSEDIKQWNWEY